MAGDRSLGTAVIGFAADVGGFVRGMNTMQEEFTTSEKLARDVTDAIGDAGVTAENAAAQFTAAVRKPIKAFEDLDGAVEKAFDPPKGISAFEEAAAEIERDILEAAEAHKKLGEEAEKAAEKQAKAAKKMSDALVDIAHQARSAGDTLASWGRTGLLATGAVTAGLWSTVKASADYETALVRLQRTTKAENDELKDLGQQFRDLSEEVPVTTNELIQIGAMGAQMGVAKDGVVEFAKTMSILGETTNITGEAGAQMLAQFANVAQVGSEDYDRLGSAIFELGIAGASTESQMLEMGVRMAGAGTVAGLTAPNILALSNALASAGIESEAGGTAFSKLIIQMAQASEKGGAQLELFADVAGMSAKSFADTWDKEPVVALQAFIKGIRDTGDAGGSLFQLLDDLDIKEVRMRTAVLNSALAYYTLTENIEIADKAFEENTGLTRAQALANESLTAQLVKFKNQLINIAVTIGNQLMPMAKDYLKTLREWADEIAAMPVEKVQAKVESLITWLKVAAVTFGSMWAVGKIISVTANIGLAIKAVKDLAAAYRAAAAAQALAGGASVAGGAATATGAALSAAAAPVALLAGILGLAAVAYKSLSSDISLMNAAIDRSNVVIDATLKKLKEKNDITDEEIKKIKALTTVNEKLTAVREHMNQKTLTDNVNLSKELDYELSKELGRQATREEILRAFVIAQSVERDAKQATQLFMRGVTDAELRDLETVTAAETAQAARRKANAATFAQEQSMSADASLKALNAQLMAAGQTAASEEELSTIRMYATQFQLTLMDAALASRAGYNDQQIALLQQGVEAEWAAAIQSDEARRADTEAQAAEMLKRAENLETFHKMNTARLVELRTEQASLQAEWVAIHKAGGDQEITDATELAAAKTRIMQSLAQNDVQYAIAKKDSLALAAAAERIHGEETAKAVGLEEELTRERVKGGEAQGIALEELRGKHADYIRAVVDSSAATSQGFAEAANQSQEQVANVIALWAESGIAVEDAAARWREAYQSLPPSGTSNVLDATLTQYGTLQDAFANLAAQQEVSGQKIHDANMMIAPSTPGSPAPLLVALGDYDTLSMAINQLANDTESATQRMHNTWLSYASQVHDIMMDVYESMQRGNPYATFSPSLVQNVTSGTGELNRLWSEHGRTYKGLMLGVYESMQYANPYARHSPSLVEQVVDGAAEMTDAEKKALEKRWSMFKRTYDDQIKKLVEFWRAGGKLSYQVNTDNRGVVTGGQLFQKPAGFDFWKDFVPVMKALNKMGITLSEFTTLKTLLQNEYTRDNAPAYNPAQALSASARAFGVRNVSNVDDAEARAQDTYLNALVGGRTPPNSLGVFRSDKLQAGKGVSINLPIMNVRTDGDIKKIAMAVAAELQALEWSNR
jgi:TP901 family phage tail tape measure protein